MNLSLAKARTWPVVAFPLKALAWAARRYLRAYNNEADHNFARNGEAWLIARTCAAERQANPICIDVGANHGKWTASVLDVNPAARVVACEMLPVFRDALHKRFSGNAAVTIIESGLSDVEERRVGYQVGGGGQLFRRPSSVKPAIETDVALARGDDLISDLALTAVHVIKIDTDGYELNVLRGLEKTIAAHRPIIQFEYSEFTGLNRTYLRDFYEFFGAINYKVGCLMPTRVAFGKYNKHEENFLTKNYVAAPAERAAEFI